MDNILKEINFLSNSKGTDAFVRNRLSDLYRAVRKQESEIERLRADNMRHLAMLREIAEYCSADGSPLGAIERLAAIRNTADRAVRAHEQPANT